jgi:hypothetical protein
MKNLLLIPILFFSMQLVAGEWRTPHSSKDLLKFLENGSDLEGNFIGVTGKVIEISTGHKGKPLFLISVTDEFGSKEIAVGSLLNADLSVGDILEILGDVIPIQEGDTKISKVTNEKVMMLGLCIVNRTKGYASGAEPAQALCNKWYLESFPQSYKDV